MKIDMYTHVVSRKYLDTIKEHVPRTMTQLVALWDLEERFRIMDKYNGYVQVLSFSIPPIETIAEPKEAIEIAHVMNEELARVLATYPDRFIAGVATLPMNDVEASLEETDRAIKDLGLKGVLIYSNINGKPLDSPEFRPLYEKMAGYDLPIWIHPYRDITAADYRTENRSKYYLWGGLGWPYETQLAMSRLVCSGILESYPNLKFITHHCGGGMPFFGARVSHWFNISLADDSNSGACRLSRRAIEYLRMFYGDTAIGDASVLECGHAFFGAGHMVFATDMPFGGGKGDSAVSSAIKAVTEMDIPDAEKKLIFEDNAKKLLRLSNL